VRDLLNHDLRRDEVGGEAKAEENAADDEQGIAVDAVNARETADNGTNENHDAVDWVSAVTIVLTSNAPAATIVVVNIDNDGANEKAGNVSDRVEKTKAPARGKAEVCLPRLERLKARDQRAVVCRLVRRGKEASCVDIQPLRNMPA
jgi:hypothetical protein